MKKYCSKICFGIILVLAVILRFSKMLWQRDFWYDEAFTGIITRMSWQDMWWMIFHDVHPPLYYYLLKPWANIFGYSVFGFRSFSLLFGVLSVISVYWIGQKIFNKRVGLLASFLMAISPFAIQYSQEARMYSLLGFIMLWVTYFFVQALQKDEWRDWLVWGVLATLLLFTHYLALFILVIFYVVAVIYKFYNTNKIKVEKKKKVSNNNLLTSFQLANRYSIEVLVQRFIKAVLVGKKFWVATGIVIVCFSLWLPAFKQHISREGLGWVPVAYIGDTPRTLQVFFYGHQPGKILQAIPNKFKQVPFSFGEESGGTLFANNSLGLILLVIIFSGVVIFAKKQAKQNNILAKNREGVWILFNLSFGILLFLIALSQLGKHFYVDRYFMPVAVVIYLLLAVVVSQWSKLWRWLFVFGYILTLLWLKPIPYDSSWTEIKNDKQLVDNNTIIVVDNAFEYATARFHFGEGRVKMYNRGEPAQDFSLWIIVKPEDQIVRLDNYLKDNNVIYVGAGDCHWNEYKLNSIKKIGRLQICGVNLK